jgi:hypothetical protein
MPLGSNIPITHRTLSPLPNKQSSIRNAIGSAQRSFQNLSGLFAGKVLRVDAANNCCDIELITGGVLHEVIIVQGAAGTMDGIYAVPKIKPPKGTKKEKEDDKSGTDSSQAGISFASSDQALQQQQENSQQTGGTSDQAAKEDDDDDVDSDDGRIPWKDIEKADLAKPENKRDTWAICGYLLDSANTPVVLGFCFPHSTQMSIKQDQKKKKDRIDYMRRLPGRHYEVHLRDATYELNFPDGSHMRVGHPKEKDDSSSTDQQQQPQPGQNPNLPAAGALAIPATAPVDKPGVPTDPANQGLQQSPGQQQDDYYDDADDDPDGRIKLGTGQYENLDKKDKPWKIKKDPKRRRMFLVHSTKAKLGICEHGAVHIQNYNDVGDESAPPEGYTDLDGGKARQQKISTGDMDAHQRRMWRARWGDQSQPPGDESKLIVGEHWFDPQAKRDRYWIRAPSDGGGNGSLNDPSWQLLNAGAITPEPGGVGTVGGEGQGSSDDSSLPTGRGQLADPSGTGATAAAGRTGLNSHGVFADAFAGGTIGTSKWSAAMDPGMNGIDNFRPWGSVGRAPTDGTAHFFSEPDVSPLNPGGTQNSVDFHMTSGPNAGATMRITHIAPGGADGTFSAGDAFYKLGARGLGSPLSPGGSNWQHDDIAISTTGSFGGHPTNSGDINAYNWLTTNGFNVSVHPGRTNGPNELLAGGDPFGGTLGGTSPGGGGFGNGGLDSGANQAAQEAKRKWYMPAAVPAGGGVQGVVQPIGEKCLDSKAAENGGMGMVDAAAADHVHCLKAAGDDDMQPAGAAGSGGTSKAFARGDHIHPGGGSGFTSLDAHQALLDKIQELEQRLALVESR